MSAALAGSARVLARLPNWLGDAVRCQPALAGLARALPADAALTLAGPAPLVELLRDCGGPELSGAALAPLRPGGRERAADWRGHDLAVLFTGSFRSAWVARAAGIPRRVGARRDGRGALLTDGTAPARERGRAPLGVGRPGAWPRALPREVGQDAAELVGALGVRVAGPARLVPTAAARAAAAERLAAAGVGEGPLVLANVGGRDRSAKAFPPEFWARTLARLAGGGARSVALVTGPGEAARADAVAALHPAASRLPGDPPRLPELAALAERCALFLTADAGPRHVAVAVGARVVTVAGPTDPRHTADALAAGPLLRAPVPCGPCHRERCPLAGAAHLACQAVSAQAVATAALVELDAAPGPGAVLYAPASPAPASHAPSPSSNV